MAVVLHGGFWRPAYGIELARPLAADLAGAGFAAVAVEYRRVGAGGGWPGTLGGVAAALDCLAGLPDASRLDLADVTAIGHSAGGHRRLAGRAAPLLPGAPGAAPRVRVTAAVLQAGVLDLAAAAAQRLGSGAVLDLLGGGPGEVPERYAAADPVRLLPTGAAALCVHGAADDVVPGRSRAGAAAAAAAAARPGGRCASAWGPAMVDGVPRLGHGARPARPRGRAGAPRPPSCDLDTFCRLAVAEPAAAHRGRPLHRRRGARADAAAPAASR